MSLNLPFWGSCQRTELFASCWKKVTVFLSSEEGRRACWTAGVWGGGVDVGVNGWQMFTEAWLHFCNHKMEEGFYRCHQKSRFTPPPQWGTCGECSSLLWRKHWASLSACRAPTLSRWPGCITLGAPAQWALCGPLMLSIPSISTLAWTGTLTASLSQKWDSTALPARAGSSRVTSNLAQIVPKLLF